MNSCFVVVALCASLVLTFPTKADNMKPVDQSTSPCASQENRQFDFWLGNWEVEDPTGKHVGTNSITSILGGCVLLENWKGDGGMTGTSLNKYVASTKQWHQTWMDDKGGFLALNGEFKGGKMVLQGNRKTKDGSSAIDRISWSKVKNDEVHQYWEQSTDGGKNWTVAFDGTYKRKKN